MKIFTHSDLNAILQQEELLKKELLNKSILMEDSLLPRKQTINNLLNYSKSLSVRDSKYLEKISLHLN